MGSLKDNGVGGKLLSAIKSFYEAASACVKINGETSEHFEIKVGLRQVGRGYDFVTPQNSRQKQLRVCMFVYLPSCEIQEEIE